MINCRCHITLKTIYCSCIELLDMEKRGRIQEFERHERILNSFIVMKIALLKTLELLCNSANRVNMIWGLKYGDLILKYLRCGFVILLLLHHDILDSVSVPWRKERWTCVAELTVPPVPIMVMDCKQLNVKYGHLLGVIIHNSMLAV